MPDEIIKKLNEFLPISEFINKYRYYADGIGYGICKFLKKNIDLQKKFVDIFNNLLDKQGISAKYVKLIYTYDPDYHPVFIRINRNGENKIFIQNFLIGDCKSA
ncbi:hypothetical protein DMUE_4805 [Dictyocoela muelleri]|nr:hypothetical protein DMUE_4805 [Dictyocoela muelleri]